MILPPWFFALFGALIGATVGSFLNVVIHRLPMGMSLIRPRSHCPHCHTPIRWYDNVPFLAWIFLLRRCRDCFSPISPRYPLVEALAMAVGIVGALRYGPNLVGLEVAVFLWVTIALGLIDLDHQILPDVMTYPTIAFGLLISWFGGLAPFAWSVAGALLGAAVPTAIIFAYRWLRGIEGMGWGDVKYLAAIGAVLGMGPVLWVLVVASFAGALFGWILMLLGRGTGKTALPFGTFLALAALLYLFLPEGWRVWNP